MSNQIKLTSNGPYIVQGDFEILDPEGRPFGLGGRTKVALCACGQSRNGPFCDGSHNQCESAWSREARDL